VFVDSVQGTLENPLWARDNISNRFEHRFDVYRAGELAVHLYLRHPNPTPGYGRSQDIFLGIARINHQFEESHENLKDPNLSKENEERAAAEFNQKGKTPNQSTTE
jgi:serum/glucocorticoid-regulated kinase 2